MAEDERIVFADECKPGQYLVVLACGALDYTSLVVLEDFVRRQRIRIEYDADPAGIGAISNG
jgi:hypothetical protein